MKQERETSAGADTGAAAEEKVVDGRAGGERAGSHVIWLYLCDEIRFIKLRFKSGI